MFQYSGGDITNTLLKSGSCDGRPAAFTEGVAQKGFSFPAEQSLVSFFVPA